MEVVVETVHRAVSSVYKILPASFSQRISSSVSRLSQTVMAHLRLKSMTLAPLVVSSVVVNGAVNTRTFDVFKYVDPLIGTMDGGR